MHSVPIRSKARPVAIPDSEQGYVLLIAIFFMALLVLALAVAAPKIAKSIQRDRELETYHRGMQFRRAIQLYYRKFQAYPPNVDALVKTNEIRFLRKKYKDPITGQDDWKPVMFGQNKTPTAMGFFGQPLAGNASTFAGIGPSGGGGLPGAMTPGGSSGGFSLGSSNTSSGQTSSPGVPSPTDTAGTTGSGSGATFSGGPTSTGTGSASSSGPTGQTFGGAGIIGFSPASPKQSILVYKKKNHYNEWEFTYDPLSDMKTIGGGNTGTIGQPATNTTTPVGTPGLGGLPIGGTTPAPMPPDTPAPRP